MPVAIGAEAWASISGQNRSFTSDGLRMSRKLMYFTSDKAKRELGYAPQPAREAIHSAIADFRRRGLCR